jgi:hypothetical protein
VIRDVNNNKSPIRQVNKREQSPNKEENKKKPMQSFEIDDSIVD